MSSPDSNIARPIALIFGIFYLAGGIISFAVTGFDNFTNSTGSTVLGLHVNGFHNVIHIGIGAILIIASRVPDAAITQGIMFGVGLVYVAATLLGFLGRLPIAAITNAGNPDNVFHLVSAVVVLFGALAGTAQEHADDDAYMERYTAEG